jgi:hypothetical protein
MRHAPGLLLLPLLLAPSACVDVRSFAGSWSGPIVPDDTVRQGFNSDARVDELLLGEVDLRGLTASLSSSDGRFHQTVLTPVSKVANDPLASLTFDGSPLRTYLLFGALASEPQAPPAWTLVSLFSDDHVELRVIRGNDLFAVFQLNRTR